MGSMHVAFAAARSRRLFCYFGQFIENPTVLSLLTTAAGLMQASELPFQLAQFPDPFCNMADVFVQKFIDLKAILSWGILESQQDSNLIQRHV